MGLKNSDEQNKNKLSWFEKKYHVLANWPGFLMYSGLCVLGIFLAVTTFVSAPILFAVGCASALIFGLRAIAKFLRITKRNQAIYWAKKLDVLSAGLLGLTLIVFGTLAFAGLLPGLSALFSIGFIISGVSFIAKSILDIKYGSENKLSNNVSEIIHKNKYLVNKLGFQNDSFDENKWADQKKYARLIISNLAMVFINGIGLTAGIFALIMSGGFIASPFLFMLSLVGIITFGFRTFASFIRTLNIHYNQTKAKIFENIALGITAIVFLGLGISLFIFPAFFAPLGTFLLAFKIISLTAGVLLSLATIAKIFFGSRANIYDAKIEINVSFDNEHCNHSVQKKAKSIGILLENDDNFEEKGKKINLDDWLDK